jgi:thymidylate synthase
MKRYTLIAAVDLKTKGIGIENGLPWKIPEDLDFFKEVTLNNTVIMGRKTWESLPFSLPNKFLKKRLNIVITRNPEKYSEYINNNLIFVESLEKALTKTQNEIYIIGGEEIYREAIKKRNCERLILTQVGTMTDIKYDTFFPDYEKDYKLIKDEKPHAGKNLLWFRTYWEYKSVNSMEEKYLEGMENIISKNLGENRTGIDTWSQFGLNFHFDLRNNILPLQTTKKMWLKGIFEEFKWIISGRTNALKLADKGVKIWLDNTSRQFLDSRGLQNYEVGDIGPTYGFNMRHYGAEYKGMNHDYTGEGVDQFENAVYMLKTNPTSRRIIIDLWNPSVIHQTALPPCMFCYTFHYDKIKNELNLHVNQRSSDFFLARNWNDVFASLLLICVSKLVGMNPGDLFVSITNSHIYETHLPQVLTQLERKAKPFPKLYIKKEFSDILDIFELEYKDLKLENYDPYPAIKADMIV